ncbi:hypothetical protein [Taibaiella helva]|uniref:hypothetical protein n=1 Tax=Taibaiella helva TaxID=2301235 RepID=UPI0013006422|nr:hypothetical protein [Taibaiella helva]
MYQHALHTIQAITILQLFCSSCKILFYRYRWRRAFHISNAACSTPPCCLLNRNNRQQQGIRINIPAPSLSSHPP